MDYDGFRNTGRDRVPHPGSPGGAVAYRICIGLWAAWGAYLTAWLASCFAGLPSDGFVILLENCGAYPAMAWYIVGAAELFGAGAWMFMASLPLRAACYVIGRAMGRPAVPFRGCLPKRFEIAWACVFILMTADATWCASLSLAPLATMMRDPTGAGPLVAVLAGPIIIMGGLVGCLACAVLAALSVPMLRFIVRSFKTALNGAKGICTEGTDAM